MYSRVFSHAFYFHSHLRFRNKNETRCLRFHNWQVSVSDVILLVRFASSNKSEKSSKTRYFLTDEDVGIDHLLCKNCYSYKSTCTTDIGYDSVDSDRISTVQTSTFSM